MRILIINADYSKFLNTLYSNKPELALSSYAAQIEARNDSLFGVADYYSHYFKSLGHEAAEIHVNNPWVQYAWAREHGIVMPEPPPWEHVAPIRAKWDALSVRVEKGCRKLFRLQGYGVAKWEYMVLSAQIEAYKPDVILNQDITYVRSACLGLLKGKSHLVGQSAAPLPSKEDYSVYDLMVSSLPGYVEYFRAQGRRAELNRLAFEPRVLEKLGPAPERDIPLSFVGSLSPEHVARIEFLEQIARHVPLQVWGNGIERLSKRSPLHACYRGEAWGRDVYEILRRSKITLNKHINLAGRTANNMRLYEATGMGAMLLTDNQVNLHEIYAPGKEVETYDDVSDCLTKINTYLCDDQHREQIAVAGQRSAVAVNNYHNRCREQIALFKDL